jgi:hypothetical protein
MGCLNECGGGPKGAHAGDCVDECSVLDCQDDWGYPSEFVCRIFEGVGLCSLP